MAADLGTLPSSGLVIQLCGDAHLSNFGVFASPERDLIVDINDFHKSIRVVRVGRKALAGPVWRSRLEDEASMTRRSERSCWPQLHVPPYHASGRPANKLDVWYSELHRRAIMTKRGTSAGEATLACMNHAAAKATSKDRLKPRDKFTHIKWGDCVSERLPALSSC
jgi:hypothetical protein